jgi:DNA-binding transcriptional ArsR family regulator
MLYKYNMSNEKDRDKIFKALADPTRRKILDLLKAKPLTTGKLCEKFLELDRCTVMLHLKVLEEADLVIAKKEGKFRWNYLNSDPIHSIYRRWIAKYEENNVSLLARLKSDLEE